MVHPSWFDWLTMRLSRSSGGNPPSEVGIHASPEALIFPSLRAGALPLPPSGRGLG
jgi:hypothetical protein